MKRKETQSKMNALFAGALSVGLFVMKRELATYHTQEIRKDSQKNETELAHMLALRESIEDFHLPLETTFPAVHVTQDKASSTGKVARSSTAS